jgi:hypothetical protein
MSTFIKIAQLGTSEADALLNERGWEDSRDYLEQAQSGLGDHYSFKLEQMNSNPLTLVTQARDYIVDESVQDSNDFIEVRDVNIANNTREFYWSTTVPAYTIPGFEGLWINESDYQACC